MKFFKRTSEMLHGLLVEGKDDHGHIIIDGINNMGTRIVDFYSDVMSDFILMVLRYLNRLTSGYKPKKVLTLKEYSAKFSRNEIKICYKKMLLYVADSILDLKEYLIKLLTDMVYTFDFRKLNFHEYASFNERLIDNNSSLMLNGKEFRTSVNLKRLFSTNIKIARQMKTDLFISTKTTLGRLSKYKEDYNFYIYRSEHDDETRYLFGIENDILRKTVHMFSERDIHQLQYVFN